MDASNWIAMVTGPAAGLILAAFAAWKLWQRVEKMIDSMQTLVVDNTKAMQAAATAMEAIRDELRELRGAKSEPQNQHIRAVPPQV